MLTRISWFSSIARSFSIAQSAASRQQAAAHIAWERQESQQSLRHRGPHCRRAGEMGVAHATALLEELLARCRRPAVFNARAFNCTRTQHRYASALCAQ